MINSRIREHEKLLPVPKENYIFLISRKEDNRTRFKQEKKIIEIDLIFQRK